ncbi:MAG: nodulation protein NfeD [Desulfurococcales archaeon]|nr:nodulation protein NfeD [Desulfurococcales archaeon]
MKALAPNRTVKLRIAFLIACMLVYFLAQVPLLAQSTEERVVHTALIIKVAPPWDTIDEGVKEYVISAIDKAEAEGSAVIIELDTYGGLLDAAFSIGDRIINSKVPVIAYVSGGKALSAGTFILMPSHIVALSPGSIIGAVQPVEFNPMTGEYQLVNESKIINPVAHKLATYARMRGRNVTAAELFVKNNLVLSAEEAVKYHVADLIASNLDDLLSKLKGDVVNISGVKYVLEISNVVPYEAGVRARLISTLSNPMVNSVLMTIGILGTIFAILSGKLPIIPLTLLFLILGLIGSGFSANLASVFMIILGAVLLAVELFVTPGFGVLGITGIVFLALGFALLPSAVPPGFAPPPGYAAQFRIFAIGLGLGLGLFTGIVLYKIIQAKRRKSTIFELYGRVGRALDELKAGQVGFVLVEGEYWRAVSDEDIPKGAEVVVVGKKDSILVVKRRVGSRPS